MNIEVQFPVYKNLAKKWGVRLDAADFEELVNFVSRIELTDSRLTPETDYFSIRCNSENEALPELYQLLNRKGWQAHFGYVQAGDSSRFGIRLVRRYEISDYSQAQYFYSKSFQNLLYTNDSSTFVGDGWIAEGIDLSDEEDDPRVASLGHYNYFVRSDLMESLQRAGLAGLSFRKLQWSNPDNASDEYWEIQCEKIMPPCLLPVVWMDDRFQYEEDGYDPEELQFRRSEVKAMEPFDVAWTSEDLGNPEKKNWGRHALVFSKKFRNVLLEHNVRQVGLNLGIVRLVEV